MFSPAEDIRTITDLKKKSLEIVEQIHRTGRPVIVTVNGKPDVFVGDIKDFQKFEEFQMLQFLKPGLDDIKAGRTRPARQVIKELMAKVNGAKKVRRQVH